MKYSIIIPAYNAEKTILRTLYSITNQDYNEIEVLVIDDGSTDNTKRIINNFDDKRIILISKVNTGVSDSRNFGINAAKGDYLIFVDADDMLPEGFLSSLDKKLHVINYTPDIIFGWYIRFDNNSYLQEKCFFDYGGNLNDIVTTDIWNVLFCKKNIFSMPIMAQVYNRKFIVNNELYFDNKQFVSEDHDWRYSLLTKGHRYYNCSLCTYLYCYNNQESVTNTDYSLGKYVNSIRYLQKWYGKCMCDEVYSGIKPLLLDLISQDFINHAIRINDIKDKNEKEEAINCFIKNDEMTCFAKPIKYKITTALYRVIGAKWYLRFINYIHKIKMKRQGRGLY